MSTISKSRDLSLEEINAFGAELDALRKETMATLGKKEADYIYGVRNFVRYTDIYSKRYAEKKRCFCTKKGR